MNNEHLPKGGETFLKEAQRNGQNKFQLWKDTDFQPEIEDLTTKEMHFLINQILLSLKSWYKKNVKVKALFDVINMPEPEILEEWVNSFDFLTSIDGQIYNATRGHKEIPGNPEFTKWSLGHVEQKPNLYGYDAEFWENQEPNGVTCCLIALSECYKVKFCLEYLENLLSNSPDSVRPEANTRKWALYYWFLMEANVMPEIRGSKKRVKELAKGHGVSGQKMYLFFNAIGKTSDLNPMKYNILEEVIPMLEEFPEARAKAELLLQKHAKK
jgi:hypothetical protein